MIYEYRRFPAPVIRARSGRALWFAAFGDPEPSQLHIHAALDQPFVTELCAWDAPEGVVPAVAVESSCGREVLPFARRRFPFFAEHLGAGTRFASLPPGFDTFTPTLRTESAATLIERFVPAALIAQIVRALRYAGGALPVGVVVKIGIDIARSAHAFAAALGDGRSSRLPLVPEHVAVSWDGDVVLPLRFVYGAAKPLPAPFAEMLAPSEPTAPAAPAHDVYRVATMLVSLLEHAEHAPHELRRALGQAIASPKGTLAEFAQALESVPGVDAVSTSDIGAILRNLLPSAYGAQMAFVESVGTIDRAFIRVQEDSWQPLT